MGAQIQVPTIKGEVEVKVPAGIYIYTVSIIYIYIGTQCNSKLRLRGQGIYNNKTKQQGDEILSFNIQIPKYIRLSITANNIGT